jgi:hypothetical protein
VEEGKDHYLGEASKCGIREDLVRCLDLGFVGAEGRERERERERESGVNGGQNEKGRKKGAAM